MRAAWRLRGEVISSVALARWRRAGFELLLRRCCTGATCGWRCGGTWAA